MRALPFPHLINGFHFCHRVGSLLAQRSAPKQAKLAQVVRHLGSTDRSIVTLHEVIGVAIIEELTQTKALGSHYFNGDKRNGNTKQPEKER